MAAVKNILFIMADQLRWDYLGCSGHRRLKTPNIDRLAAMGVRFDKAFCNAPVCGPSRASFYTGRYVMSHGGNYNNFPLRVDEQTIGDYLAPLGVRTALVGKTHMKADLAGMQRLGIDPGSDLGLHLAHTGFEPFEHDDGLHPTPGYDPDMAYNRYLRALGYEADNPWHDFANAAAGSDGSILSGWAMRNARLPARVAESHSETAYMTDRAMAFIDGAGDDRWCLHLSYIKPHWPYMAPAPYHNLYGPEDIPAANRSQAERDHPHPVTAAFMAHGESLRFAEDICRRTVIPTYMGLIQQIDDHLGRLFSFLEERGLWDNTMIVFTADHGDYLGDHWLGEKELFHEESVRIPMIIRDPRAQADHSRGQVRADLVEAIDLLPTFLDALEDGNADGNSDRSVAETRLEGRSLMPLIASDDAIEWRDAVFAECDFCFRHARRTLGLAAHEARGFMARTDDWKYIYWPQHPAQLFDLTNDPCELHDLGGDPAYATTENRLQQRLMSWFALRRNRITLTDARVEASTGKAKERGYLFGEW